VTDPGQVPVAVVSGLGTNKRANRFQYVNISQAAKSYLYMCNGNNNPIVIEYPNIVHRLVAGNGTTPWTLKGTDSTGGVLDPSQFIGITTYQRMIWFVKRDSASAWWMNPGILWGDIFEFDVGPWMTRGGFLMALANWTIDDSNNTQSRLVAITSGGEAIVFQGTDPTDFTDWKCVGTYFIGKPMGRRCYCKMGADLLVLTQQGIVSMTDITNTSTDELFRAGNGRIVQQLIQDATANYGSKYGWAIMYVPRANMLVLNMPQLTDLNYRWLVLNTITKAWCIFSNMPAFSMTLFYNQPMFAMYSTIYEGWIGTLDRVGADGTGGEAIEAECQQAFYGFGAPTQQKHFKYFRPTFITDGTMTYKAAINFDYSFKSIYGLVPAVPPIPALWDAALWDSPVYTWGSTLGVDNNWASAVGSGYVASIKLKVSATQSVLWASTDFIFEDGGMI